MFTCIGCAYEHRLFISSCIRMNCFILSRLHHFHINSKNVEIATAHTYFQVFCCFFATKFVFVKLIIYQVYHSFIYLSNFFCFSCQLQSLLWIAISILAILSYHCVFNFRGIHASLATLTELTLFQMYFRGMRYNLSTKLAICIWITLIND